MLQVRTLVVDDFSSFRRRVCWMLEENPEVRLIGEAADGAEAVQKAVEFQPDLILLDSDLPKLSGIEAARQIRKVVPKSKLLFVSQDSNPEVVQAAFQLGARVGRHWPAVVHGGAVGRGPRRLRGDRLALERDRQLSAAFREITVLRCGLAVSGAGAGDGAVGNSGELAARVVGGLPVRQYRWRADAS